MRPKAGVVGHGNRVAEARRMAELASGEVRPEKALERYRAAMALLDGQEDEPLFADTLRWMGTVQRELGDSVEAESLYTRSLRLAEAHGHVGSQAHALNCLALIAQRRAQMEIAAGYYRRAALLAVRSQDHRLKGMIEQNLGVLESIRGDLDSALVRYRDSLNAFELAKDDQGRSWVLNNLGMLYTTVGQFQKAEVSLTKALELARRRSDLHMESLILVNKGALLIRLERFDDAESALTRALTLADSRRDTIRRGEVHKYRAVIRREQNALDEAMTLLATAQDLAVESGDTLLCAEILRELGDTWAAKGDIKRAVGCWEQARVHFLELGAVLESVEVQRKLRTHHASGDPMASGERESA